MERKDVAVVDSVESLVDLQDRSLTILRFRHPGTPFPVSMEVYALGRTDAPLPFQGLEDFASRLAKALSADILTDDDTTIDPYCGLLFTEDGAVAEVDMQFDDTTGDDVVQVRHRRYRRSPGGPGTL